MTEQPDQGAVREQGRLSCPLEALLEPAQDPVLAGRRGRSRPRPARRLFHVRLVGQAPDQPASQWRHLQSGPPQSRAGAGADRRHPVVRHRQPPFRGPRPHRTGGGPGRHHRRPAALHDLRLGRRRGRRHRPQDRPPRHQAAPDRLDPEGLSRPYRPGPGHGRRALQQALSVRSAGRVHPGAVQRPRRHGGALCAATTRPP